MVRANISSDVGNSPEIKKATKYMDDKIRPIQKHYSAIIFRRSAENKIPMVRISFLREDT